MPNLKSAKKRAIQNEKKRKINAARKTIVKNAVKRVITSVETSDLAGIQEILREAESKLAHAKKKGILHPNTASRKISRLAKRVAQAKKVNAQK